MIMSRFRSNTEIPVPSNSTREGSFCDLNLKKTEDVIVSDTGEIQCRRVTELVQDASMKVV